MMFKNPKLGINRPMDTKQTVKGVDKSKPTGPHSQVQNTAAASTASGVMPVEVPYSHGSITFATMISMTAKRPKVNKGLVQLGSTANARANGIEAAIHAPAYG